MEPIRLGLTGEHRTLVTDELAIRFLGMDSARVLATPALILLMEMTARNSLKPLLEDGFDSVGAEVSIRHLAATPMGMEVAIRTQVTAVEGRKVRFRVEAHDEKEKVAEGTHERFIVNTARFAERLRAKRPGG